jgi:uroporphyrinogen-III decarboxylase
MTSRDRIKAALNHKEADRIPIDFGSVTVTGMHYSCVAALREYYGLEKHPIKIAEPCQMLGLIEDDLKDAIGIDVEGVFSRTNMFGVKGGEWREWRQDNGEVVLVEKDLGVTTDEMGHHYIHPCGDTSVAPCAKMPKNGFYFDALSRQEPFDDIEELDPNDNLEEFGYVTDSVLSEFEEDVDRALATGRAVSISFGGTALGDIALVPGLNLKHPKGVRDVAEWYMATATSPDYIKYVFDKQTDIAISNLERLNKKMGEKIDVIFICGTDFGTQISTFCSSDTFKNVYMPYYKKVNDWIHANTGWKTFKHSCGAVESFIPMFIESGFDILNPVQCSAVGMEPRLLKEKYGRDIVFWGGGIDTQKILPFGTPSDVKEQVKERCEIFGRDGGYVFNTIHNVQAGTPVENLVAMIDAFKEFGK